MNRVLQSLVQGSDEWKMFRLKHHGASEAAAMLGMSLNVKRSELLRMKHTGLPQVFSDWVQENILDHGHEVEALARPHIEALIGDDLYPVTYAMGRLSASCDGLNFDGTIAMEHKQWSASLVARLDAGEFPAEHIPQCQQVLLVTGAKRLIFVVSDGTPEKMRHVWVTPEPTWFDRITRGWAQFDADLGGYKLEEAEAPAPVGRAPDQLPALTITITGGVQSSNLAEFKQTALGAIKSVNRSLKTDQDFADADKSVKWCQEVESKLKAAKEHALGQTASIELLFRTMDEIAAESKKVRLDLEKLVEARKLARRGEIVAESIAKVKKHVDGVNDTLPARWIPHPSPAFGEAIKGKRSFASMQEACDVLVAEAKITTDALAERLLANRQALTVEGKDWISLVPDFATVGTKSVEDFEALAQLRINRHLELERQATEAKKKADDEAAAAKATADAAAAATAAAVPAPPLAAAPAAETAPAPAPAPAAVVSTMQSWQRSPGAAAAPAAPSASTGPATLNLGAICTRLGFTVTGAFVSDTLCVQSAAVDRGIKYWRESDFPRIVGALQRHLASVLERQAEPA